MLTLYLEKRFTERRPKYSSQAESLGPVAWISLLEGKQRGRWICHVNELAGSKGHSEGGGGEGGRGGRGGRRSLLSGLILYNLRAAAGRTAAGLQ